MKNIITSATFIVVVSMNSVFAINPPVRTFQSGMYVNKSGELVINVENTGKSKLKLLVKNDKQHLVFSDAVASRSSLSSIRVDMSELKDGGYDVILKNETESESRHIKIKSTASIYNRTLTVN